MFPVYVGSCKSVTKKHSFGNFSDCLHPSPAFFDIVHGMLGRLIIEVSIEAVFGSDTVNSIYFRIADIKAIGLPEWIERNLVNQSEVV